MLFKTSVKAIFPFLIFISSVSKFSLNQLKVSRPTGVSINPVKKANNALFAFLTGLIDTPVGLDTLSWFKENLLTEEIKIKNGNIALTDVLNNINNINYNLLEPLDF